MDAKQQKFIKDLDKALESSTPEQIGESLARLMGTFMILEDRFKKKFPEAYKKWAIEYYGEDYDE